MVTTNDDGLLFTAFPPDDDFLTDDGKLDPEKYKKHFSDIYTKMQAEGSVLLKNEGNTLPVSGSNKKITLLGRRSYTSNIHTSHTNAGFTINPLVQEAYGSGTKNGVAALPSLMSPPLRRNAAYAKFDAREGSAEWLMGRVTGGVAAAEDSFVEYGDAAIVTLGRNGAEGPDYEASANGVTAESGARNPMGLSTNEKDIVNLACEKFDKVIVLIHTVNMMELGWLKDNPKVGAILWIGMPRNGAPAIGQVISGQVNPSGGLYNIYARNSLSAPAIMNVNSFYFTNWMDFGEGIPNWDNDAMPAGPNYPGNPNNPSAFYPGETPIDPSAKKGDRVDTASVDTRGTDPGLENYLIEAENIYVGYRYYETRYYDCVNGDSGAKSTVGAYDSTSGWNYDQEVAYGFGYGLSYTKFEMTMGEPTFTKSSREIIAHVPVTVKNTGGVKGKASVQLYAQSPYTAYDKTNLVEKSAVQLLAFEKTKELDPDATQTITVDVDLANLASYDYKKAKTYIMDISDDYYFAVGNGAHDALNNILAAQGKTVSNGMTYNGRAAAVRKWSHVHPNETAEPVDAYTFSLSKTGEKVTNQIPYSSYDYYESGVVTELSRQNWNGTYPKSYVNLTANQKIKDHYNGHYIDIKTKDSADKDSVSDVVWGMESDLRFGDMIKADFNDYRWEELLDQLTIEEAIQGTIQGGRGFADMPSIGFPTGRYSENGAGNPRWYDDNSVEQQAPWKIPNPGGSVASGSWPELSIIASTFNPELSHEWGRLLGNAAIFSETFIIWQPGANTHRHAYNGRMFLYYSEDPVLTGIHSMETAIGALKKGGIVCAKHFAFNDQEMHRAGVGVFMTEQRAREIELRAFQIPFEASKYDTDEKDVGMMGTMTAFNKIGGVECTTSQGLLTNILRKEWGHDGYVVSDLKDDLDLMRQGIKAGMTGYDWRTFEHDVEPWDDTEDWSYDKELMEAMKDAIKRDLYMFANSSLMNRVNSSTYTKWNLTWWRASYISGIIASSVLLAASMALYVASVLLQKKKGGV